MQAHADPEPVRPRWNLRLETERGDVIEEAFRPFDKPLTTRINDIDYQQQTLALRTTGIFGYIDSIRTISLADIRQGVEKPREALLTEVEKTFARTLCMESPADLSDTDKSWFALFYGDEFENMAVRLILDRICESVTRPLNDDIRTFADAIYESTGTRARALLQRVNHLVNLRLQEGMTDQLFRLTSQKVKNQVWRNIKAIMTPVVISTAANTTLTYQVEIETLLALRDYLLSGWYVLGKNDDDVLFILTA